MAFVTILFLDLSAPDDFIAGTVELYPEYLPLNLICAETT